MTIALATRGYLYPRTCVQVVMGAGPSITGAQELLPEVVGAVPSQAEGPSIQGSVQPAPSISGGGYQRPVRIEPPFISGGTKPKIK